MFPMVPNSTIFVNKSMKANISKTVFSVDLVCKEELNLMVKVPDF